MTNRELLAELKKPGKIWMPVEAPHRDTVNLLVEKADLIRFLKTYTDMDGDAPWRFFGNDQSATDRWLEVNK